MDFQICAGIFWAFAVMQALKYILYYCFHVKVAPPPWGFQSYLIFVTFQRFLLVMSGKTSNVSFSNSKAQLHHGPVSCKLVIIIIITIYFSRLQATSINQNFNTITACQFILGTTKFPSKFFGPEKVGTRKIAKNPV